MDELDLLRRRLNRKRKKIDKEAPEHSYDSALFLAAKAGGLQEAVEMIDKIKESKGRRFTIDKGGATTEPRVVRRQVRGGDPAS